MAYDDTKVAHVDTVNAADWNAFVAAFKARTHARGPYAAIVYPSGTDIIAETATGTEIASGSLGTDDTATIQAAIDSLHVAVASGPRGAVCLADGKYSVTDTLKLYNGIGLVAALPSWYKTAAATIGAVLVSASMNKPILRLVGDATYTNYAWFPYVENVCIWGDLNAAHTSNHGIHIEIEAGSPVLNDVYLKNVMIGNCGANGIHSNIGGKIWIDGGYTEDNKGHGIYLKASGGGTVRGMYVYGNSGDGIHVADSGPGVVIAHNHIRSLTDVAGIRTYTAGKSVVIAGNEIQGISGTTTGVEIEVNDQYKKVLITSNLFFNLTNGVHLKKGAYWTSAAPMAVVMGNAFNTVTNPVSSTDFTLTPPNIKIGMNLGDETENHLLPATITTPAGGDVLTWNGTAWVNLPGGA